jgi:hypothetical protein
LGPLPGHKTPTPGPWFRGWSENFREAWDRRRLKRLSLTGLSRSDRALSIKARITYLRCSGNQI